MNYWEPPDPPELNYAKCMDCGENDEIEVFTNGVCPNCGSRNIELNGGFEPLATHTDPQS